jgi:hypothetical protein
LRSLTEVPSIFGGRGNTASEARPRSVTVAAAYDGHRRRLTGYDRSGAGTHAHSYNGPDDRVAVVTPAGVRRFVYGPDGRSANTGAKNGVGGGEQE